VIVLDASAAVELLLGTPLGERRAAQALSDLSELDLTRHPHQDLIDRAWAMRATVSAYDAMYLALGEALEATVLTCDQRLARAHGHGADVELVGPAA
jgi:predicted nucleic acid-binding protein